MYEVSNLGRVRRVAAGPGTYPGRVLATPIPKPTSPGNERNAYPRACLQQAERGQIALKVHRLVALAFIGPPPEGKPFVNHKNGVKRDNRLENLEWCSAAENSAHSVASGFQPAGVELPQSKLTDEGVVCAVILRLAGWKGKEIARRLGVSTVTANKAASGRSWRHVFGGAS